jgi:hypothetical protein
LRGRGGWWAASDGEVTAGHEAVVEVGGAGEDGAQGFLPAVVAVVGRKVTTHAMTTGGGRRRTHGVKTRPCWWGPQPDLCARGFSR